VAVLGIEFLRFLDGMETAKAEDRHQEILDRLAKVAVVSTGNYDEKKVFKEYFPADVDSEDVYKDVEWGSDIEFQMPDEDELETLRRLLEDNAVTVSGVAYEGPEDLPLALPDGAPAIETIETDREWV
jgi:predicted DNA binding protein